MITRHGKAAGVLIGFESEDDWFDYRLENDPRFLNRIAQARSSLRARKPRAADAAGVRLAQVPLLDDRCWRWTMNFEVKFVPSERLTSFLGERSKESGDVPLSEVRQKRGI